MFSLCITHRFFAFKIYKILEVILSHRINLSLSYIEKKFGSN